MKKAWKFKVATAASGRRLQCPPRVLVTGTPLLAFNHGLPLLERWLKKQRRTGQNNVLCMTSREKIGEKKAVRDDEKSRLCVCVCGCARCCGHKSRHKNVHIHARKPRGISLAGVLTYKYKQMPTGSFSFPCFAAVVVVVLPLLQYRKVTEFKALQEVFQRFKR